MTFDFNDFVILTINISVDDYELISLIPNILLNFLPGRMLFQLKLDLRVGHAMIFKRYAILSENYDCNLFTRYIAKFKVL